MTTFAVVAEGLWKRYGTTVALGGFDLAVPEGTVCGLLGPNGAGKTTAVRILATLLRADGGHAEVTGFDVARQPVQVRYRIGLTGQRSTVDDVLTGRENLELFGRLYHLGPHAACRRADELLEQFSLTEAAGRPPKQYSGGMRRRLDLAASFIMAPPVLFLDEPTTGLDPSHRSEVWHQVRSLVTEGTTVLLTTHYLDEADQLADTIAVIDHGNVRAEGTPDQLKATLPGGKVEVLLSGTEEVTTAAEILTRIAGAEPDIDTSAGRVSVPAINRVDTLTRVARALDEASLAIADIALRRPTLDEVFVHLTNDTPAQAEPASQEVGA